MSQSSHQLAAILLFRTRGRKEQADLLSVAYHLKDVNLLARGTAKELIRASSREISQRMEVGQSKSVTYGENVVHCHIKRYFDDTTVSCCVVSDLRFTPTAAFKIMHMAFAAFDEAYVTDASKHELWRHSAGDAGLPLPALDALLAQYQERHALDKIGDIMNEVDETKNIMSVAIESMLDNGESAEDVLDKAIDLKAKTKVFAKSSKKLNKRCYMCSIQ